MNNSSFLDSEEVDRERMTSIIIDVETDNSNQSISDSIGTQLKSILKKTHNFSDEDRLQQLKIVKICNSITILVICIPIIFCDIYYSLIDVSCSNKIPSYLDVSLKIYLLLSGFINLILITFAIIMIIYVKEFGNKNDIAYLLNIGNLYISCIFNLIWNIIGSIIFWGYIYYTGECKIGFSTYVFISLIIKLFVNFLSIFHIKNKNNNH